MIEIAFIKSAFNFVFVFKQKRPSFTTCQKRYPVTRCSKQKKTVTLSTTESKYIALSNYMHEIIPIQHLLTKIHKHAQTLIPAYNGHNSIIALTQCFELLPSTQVNKGNASCITICNSEATYCPHMKHIAVKYHHFKDALPAGQAKVVKIALANNTADIFTKHLGPRAFVKICKHLH